MVSTWMDGKMYGWVDRLMDGRSSHLYEVLLRKKDDNRWSFVFGKILSLVALIRPSIVES